MHQGVIKVSHTFLYGIEITVLKTVMTIRMKVRILTQVTVKIQIPCRMTRKIIKKPSQCRNESSLESKVKDLGSTV